MITANINLSEDKKHFIFELKDENTPLSLDNIVITFQACLIKLNDKLNKDIKLNDDTK